MSEQKDLGLDQKRSVAIKFGAIRHDVHRRKTEIKKIRCNEPKFEVSSVEQESKFTNVKRVSRIKTNTRDTVQP